MGEIVNIRKTNIDSLLKYLKDNEKEWTELYIVGIKPDEDGSSEINYHHIGNNSRFRILGALEYLKNKLLND